MVLKIRLFPTKDSNKNSFWIIAIDRWWSIWSWPKYFLGTFLNESKAINFKNISTFVKLINEGASINKTLFLYIVRSLNDEQRNTLLKSLKNRRIVSYLKDNTIK